MVWNIGDQQKKKNGFHSCSVKICELKENECYQLLIPSYLPENAMIDKNILVLYLRRVFYKCMCAFLDVN